MMYVRLVHLAVAVGVASMSVGAVRPAHAQASARPSAPPDTVRLTLAEAIVQSLDVSPEVGQRAASRRFASARSEQAEASRFLTDVSANTAHSVAPGLDIPSDNTLPADQLYLNPNVENDWSIDALRPFTRAEIVARQPLVTWGELSGNVRAAEHGVAVEEARVEEKVLEVGARTGELYYNLLLTEALERLAQRTGDVIDRAKREIDRLLDEGDESVDEADLYQTRLTEEEFKRRVVEIDQNQATARSALRRQLFLPDAAHIVPSDEEIRPLDFSLHPDSLDYYLDLALNERPEIQQAQAGVRAREALVDVARSDYFPKIGVQASFGVNFTLPDRPNQDNAFVGDAFGGVSTRTGFGIQQNLNFGQTAAKVDQAEAELQEVKHQQTAARQLIQFEVEEAYRKYLTAKTNLESRERATTISGDWLRDEQVTFDLGFGDTENLVKAVRADLEAEARYFEAVRTYNVAVLRLLEATGTLTDRARSGTLIEPSSASGE